MKTYTGWQYLLIDVANQFGHDKWLFEERIKWAEDNLSQLEDLTDQAETKPLYIKAVMAVRKAQQGIPSGHLVGLDATCSGMQIMSAMTGCVAGADSTGLINPNERADAYSKATKEMIALLQTDSSTLSIERQQAKDAVMTAFYGSKKVPKDLFGENTPELAAFYQTMMIIAPGAWELLQDLLASWQPYALCHSWTLPDGFEARVKVMKKQEIRIEVDELDHATFTYEFYENEGAKSGLSNVANVTHSMDAWVLRSMHRRCNYDRDQAVYVDQCIQAELVERSIRGGMDKAAAAEFMTPEVAKYIKHYERSTLADTVILPHLDQATVSCLSTEHLQGLARIIRSMLAHKPFELVTVHDEFKAHPNNCNAVRMHYREILAEIAESNVLDDILSQIHGVSGTFNKLSFNLPAQIRNSAYALC